MRKLILILFLFPVLLLAQSRTFAPTLRATSPTPLTVTQVDGNFTGVANTANSASRAYISASQVGMLALVPTPQIGDWCWRTDLSTPYIFSGGDATFINNWYALAGVVGKFNLPAIAGTTTNGDIWQDVTQLALGTYQNGLKQVVSTTIFTATASATVANTVSETSIVGTGVGTKTLPANFLVAGKHLRLLIRGVLSTTGTPTLQVKVKLGSTVLLDSTAHSLASGIPANANFVFEGDLTCRSTGVSGTVQGSADLSYQITPASGAAERHWLPLNLATVNTTTSGALDITVTWGTASASNTITGAICSIAVTN